ncbi:MAG: UDP-glucose 4-epimerase [Arenicella sp.]|jgi:UDP-glucose 4-epimerase
MQQISNKILVTGGAGYIGSHTVVSLVEQGFEVVVLDNFSNSRPMSMRRVEQITGVKVEVINADLRNEQLMKAAFRAHKFDAVIHFAGLKAVGESIQQPLRYYQNNVDGSLQLLKAMSDSACKKIVFSSSATVYGDPSSVPITESFPLSATNPYGQSKLMVENILRDLFSSDKDWQISILRYFNPVSAHESGVIGEDPNGIPNNLMPYISQVGVGRLECLSVYGDDYDTPDGTGVRDYIHVVDLADAHIKALKALNSNHGCQSYNIGTGRGYSVLEMVKAFERASGQAIKLKIVPRRAGDIASCYADTGKSAQTLGWLAKRNLDDMMRDLWHWQQTNPNGYN